MTVEWIYFEWNSFECETYKAQGYFLVKMFVIYDMSSVTCLLKMSKWDRNENMLLSMKLNPLGKKLFEGRSKHLGLLGSVVSLLNMMLRWIVSVLNTGLFVTFITFLSKAELEKS